MNIDELLNIVSDDTLGPEDLLVLIKTLLESHEQLMDMNGKALKALLEIHKEAQEMKVRFIADQCLKEQKKHFEQHMSETLETLSNIASKIP